MGKKPSKHLDDVLAEALEGVFQADLSDAAVAEIFLDVLGGVHPGFLDRLKAKAPAMLADFRADAAAFEQRNLERWKKPLDYLTMFWVCCEELSSEHNAKRARFENDPVYGVLSHLQPKALLIAREAIRLMEAGYADGALTRWRSLHEVAVTAMFIAKHCKDAMDGYLCSSVFANLRAAENFNRHAQKAGLIPIPEEDIAYLRAAQTRAAVRLGRKLTGDWDRAKPFLSGRSNFAEVEKDVGMDHWRPGYKWACRHIHSGYEYPTNLLGMSESEEGFFQVGPSNSGMAEPIHLIAITLCAATMQFLHTPEPDSETIVFSKTLLQMRDEIGELAEETAEATLKQARQQSSPAMR